MQQQIETDQMWVEPDQNVFEKMGRSEAARRVNVSERTIDARCASGEYRKRREGSEVFVWVKKSDLKEAEAAPNDYEKQAVLIQQMASEIRSAYDHQLETVAAQVKIKDEIIEMLKNQVEDLRSQNSGLNNQLASGNTAIQKYKDQDQAIREMAPALKAMNRKTGFFGRLFGR